MTTPWATYFHKATRSLRASATIALLRPRWLCALNQRVKADCGWCRSHSQASWIIVVRNRGLPAFDTPCGDALAKRRHRARARRSEGRQSAVANHDDPARLAMAAAP